jgi:hypothetical protein
MSVVVNDGHGKGDIRLLKMNIVCCVGREREKEESFGWIEGENGIFFSLNLLQLFSTARLLIFKLSLNVILIKFGILFAKRLEMKIYILNKHHRQQPPTTLCN